MHASALVLAVLLSCVYSVPFQAELNLLSRIKLGDDVICKVTITNPTDDDFFLFYRATPLESNISNIFSITMNGSELHFDGPLFKRSAVSMNSEGIKMKAHMSVTVGVDLSLIYSLSERSSYTASLSSQIYFMKLGDNVISHGQLQSYSIKFVLYGEEFVSGKKTLGEKHRRLERAHNIEDLKESVKVAGSPLSVKFAGSRYDSVDISDANKAWENAYDSVVKGQKDMVSNTKHYSDWFGVPPSTIPSSVLNSLQKSMETSIFTLYFNGAQCEDRVFAYTYYNSKTLYLCRQYFYAQDTGYNSKFGTVVHEMTHAVRNTKDIAYGEYDCKKIMLTTMNSL